MIENLPVLCLPENSQESPTRFLTRVSSLTMIYMSGVYNFTAKLNLQLRVTKELSVEKKLEIILFPTTIKLWNEYELIIYFNRVSRSHLAV